MHRGSQRELKGGLEILCGEGPRLLGEGSPGTAEPTRGAALSDGEGVERSRGPALRTLGYLRARMSVSSFPTSCEPILNPDLFRRLYGNHVPTVLPQLLQSAFPRPPVLPTNVERERVVHRRLPSACCPDPQPVRFHLLQLHLISPRYRRRLLPPPVP